MKRTVDYAMLTNCFMGTPSQCKGPPPATSFDLARLQQVHVAFSIERLFVFSTF